MVERIEDNDGNLLAIIIRNSQLFPNMTPGVHFITHPDDGLQVGFINHLAGHRIDPHTHLARDSRPITITEVIEVRTGRVQIEFYPVTQEVGGYCQCRILKEKDVVVLLAGGHGFRVLEDCELLEVKQGPYVRHDQDKKML